jgi:hypothetical protein
MSASDSTDPKLAEVIEECERLRASEHGMRERDKCQHGGQRR